MAMGAIHNIALLLTVAKKWVYAPEAYKNIFSTQVIIAVNLLH